MDQRIPLKPGTVLESDGCQFHIESLIGCGSNALVYKGWYPDRLDPQLLHHILIKELFPFHPHGEIFRREDHCLCISPAAESHWLLHKESFLAGNSVHLRLLADHPEILGTNLNSFPANGTLYSILGYSGGRSLQQELNRSQPTLRKSVQRMLLLLDALEAFHKSGFLHLDISPDNVMLVGSDDAERAFLIDYNSALALGSPTLPTLSCKPGYSPPEAETFVPDAIGFPSDLYSVTAVFFRSISGRTLTLEEMLQPRAPGGSSIRLLDDAPQTVVSMVTRILQKGLHTLPARRYQSTGQLRQAFLELLDRIDCIGITHWSLWENGKRNIDRLIQDNPALHYLKASSGLFPIRLEQRSVDQYLETTLSPAGHSGLIVAQGGMGKTTMLLQTALRCCKKYTPSAPAVFYVSLNGWDGKDPHYIQNQILLSLRFKQGTNTYETARHMLHQLLSTPLKTPDGDRPVLLLLLDGLNEVRGDSEMLIREINLLNRLPGVRLLVTSRQEQSALNPTPVCLSALELPDITIALGGHGLLLPESKTVLQLLRTPLILSLYIQSSAAGKQPDVHTEEELLQTYLQALLQKELAQLPEEQAPLRWQLEASLSYVLPEIARKAQCAGRPLTEAQLLSLIKHCWKVLRSPLGKRIFPQWIGHSKDIFHGAKDPEQWYGIVIHRILWQQLGILSRQPDGSYSIYHQILEKHLASYHRPTLNRIRRLQAWVTGITAAAILFATVLTGGVTISYLQSLSAPAVSYYDEKQSSDTLEHLVAFYSNFGTNLTYMQNLVNYAAENNSQSFFYMYDYYFRKLHEPTILTENLTVYLENIATFSETGQQIPWSKQRFDHKNATALLQQLYDLQQQYQTYLPLLNTWMSSERVQRFAPDLPAALQALLDADIKVLSKLYFLTCYPHLVQNDDNWSHRVRDLAADVPGAQTEPNETLEALLNQQVNCRQTLLQLQTLISSMK